MPATCRCPMPGGLRAEHCTECHQNFTGTSAGDKHRTGKHHVRSGPDARRCLTTDEMTAKGMTRNKRGVWTSGGSYWTDPA